MSLSARLSRRRTAQGSAGSRSDQTSGIDATSSQGIVHVNAMNLREMADLFEHGVQVKDRKWCARSYPRCFVGKEAVSFMMKAKMAASREEAVRLGRRFCNEYNMFEHVHRDHDFKDQYLFYHFVGKRKRFVPTIDEFAATLALNEALMGIEDDDDTSTSSRTSAASSAPGGGLHDLREVAKALEGGVEVKDRKWHLRTYTGCFLGADAVDYLIINGYVRTRADALKLGRRLAAELNLFYHVTGDHLLKDDLLFYRFTKEEDRTHWKPAQSDTRHPMTLKEKAVAFERGVKVQTNRYHLRSYPKTFVGSKAVDFMVKSGLADSRIAAVELGQELARKINMFGHVVGAHEFRDDYLFYRFTEEKDRICISPDMLSLGASINDSSYNNDAGISIATIGEILCQGIMVKDIKRGKKIYKNCFVAAEAVEFLVDSSLAETRREAVLLGRTVESSLSLFEYVSTKGSGDRKAFSDDDILFRFTEKQRFQMSERSSSRSSASSTSEDSVSLEEIAEALRKNIIVKDRRWHLKTYKQCFVGKHAVDFLIMSKFAESREEAVKIGRDLMQSFNLFHHVSNDRDFEDEYLFYRFVGGPIRKKSSGSVLQWNNMELKSIAKAFETGVKVKDNRYHLRLYRGTFTGKDAVTFLVESGNASTREEALGVGHALAKEFNLFQDVASCTCSMEPDKKGLVEDSDSRIYRFTKINQRWSWDDNIEHDEDLEASVLELGVESDDKEWADRVKAFERNKLVSFYSPSRASLMNSGHRPSRTQKWASEFYRSDPRYQIFQFFAEVAQDGAIDVERFRIDIEKIRPLLRYIYRGSVFTVWRPTRLDAIRRMMMGEAVGKGLDIKGKSAIRGKLSGYVPFLQISDNKHKGRVRPLPKIGAIRVFFPGDEGVVARDTVAQRCETVAMEMLDVVKEARKVLDDTRANADARKDALKSMLLDLADPSIVYIDDYVPISYGLEIPIRLFWEAFVVRQDITRQPGSQYDGGRPSQPAFQDMNLGALQAPPISGTPRAVLIQNEHAHDPMNVFELLMGYEEHGRVLPVVSDFDNFLCGTRGISYSKPLPSDQVDLLKNSISCIEEILDGPNQPESWTSRWLAVIKKQTDAGFHPHIPRFGFGDPKSIGIVQNATKRLANSGAVRHGSECFNFYFPQDLDDQYLVILPPGDGGDLKWEYVDVKGLQQILLKKINNGYTFPLNPKWVLCDPGWWEIYNKLLSSRHRNVQESLNVWFPPESGVREQIERIHTNHPDGFQRQSREDEESANSLLYHQSGTAPLDLALEELEVKEAQ